MNSIIEFLVSDDFVSIVFWTLVVITMLFAFSLVSMGLPIGLFIIYICLSVGTVDTVMLSSVGLVFCGFGLFTTIKSWWLCYRYIRGDDGIDYYE